MFEAEGVDEWRGRSERERWVEIYVDGSEELEGGDARFARLLLAAGVD